MFITNDTLSTIITEHDGSCILTVYHEKRILHEKQYKTFSAAKAQETRILNRYDLFVSKSNNFSR